MIRTIKLAELHPHPGNPRLAPHQDVVDQIAAQLNGGMDEAHALIVRPNAAGYEILSGHHRCLAAIKAGLEVVPCHVREMSDADAYMALALNNAQRELTALERGFHALRSPLDGKAYAKVVGRAQRTVADEICAARVAESVADNRYDLTGRIAHLSVIHAAPSWLWPALVVELVAGNWTVEIARGKVKTFAELAPPPEWADVAAIATGVVTGTHKKADVARMQKARDAAKVLDVDLITNLDTAILAARPGSLSDLLELISKAEAAQATRDALARAAAIKIQREHEDAAKRAAAEQERRLRGVTVDEWKTLEPDVKQWLLGEHGEVGRGINKQDNDAIEWAQWSWNPVVGCLHDCPYCYARDIATDAKFAGIYPDGFTPAIRPRTLIAMRGKEPSGDATFDTRFRNVFTCSMADLFGRWVPAEWIEAVYAEMRAAPQWNFLCLTKFPKRMAEFDNPVNAWMGTTVDLQARVNAAEAGFAKVKAGVRWLSIEPFLEPLRFKRLEHFDWMVIGGSTASSETPDWWPPFEWIADLVRQARDANVKVYFKTNLGIKNRILELPFDAPIKPDPLEAPAIFHYLESGRR